MDDFESESSSEGSAWDTPESAESLLQAEDGADSPIVVGGDISSPTPPPEVTGSDIIHARAYQVEMFEESLKQNVIIAMDTGSGKTQVAVLRIQEELARSPPGKIIWFITPTVALCLQQLGVLKSQIPGAQIKSLTGSDGVDTWKNKSIWDSFLDNVGVIVSTPQVLLDALSHAFVGMDVLSLLVFDEAHRCVGNNPGAKIMKFYHDMKATGNPVPSILGLTASPVVKSSISDMEKIERTLDSVCKAPSRHQDELLSQVEKPSLSCSYYEPEKDSATSSITSLNSVLRGLKENIQRDPFVIQKYTENTERSRHDIQRAFQKQKTPIIEQMNIMYRASTEVRRELGPWAADYFVYIVITQHLKRLEKDEPGLDLEYKLQERKYLADALRRVQAQKPSSDNIQISDKVEALIRELLSGQEHTLGIVFVQQTATVNALRAILTIHPLTRDRFRVGSMVGTSRYPGRQKPLGELAEDDGYSNLMKFRCGKLDILIATNVLEEGIDIPACNLVVCFDPPQHLLSFIQRRGRARMRKSRLAVLRPRPTEPLSDTEADKYLQFQNLELEMKKAYEDEMREKQEWGETESLEESDVPPYITNIGAQLDFDQAKSHLGHFCATLSSHKFVDWRPFYLVQDIKVSILGPSMKKATVILPVSLPAHLRRVESEHVWYSEKNACKDAAFQAYKQLHEAGLVNNHLLPFHDDEVQRVGTRASIVEVNECWKPWPTVARAWSGSQRYRRPITVIDQDQATLCQFDFILPIPTPFIPDFSVYWDMDPWKVTLGSMEEVFTIGHDQTMALIASAYSHRFKLEDNSGIVFRLESSDNSVSNNVTGTGPVTQEFAAGFSARFANAIRNHENNGLYLFEAWLPSRPPLDQVKMFKKCLLDHPTEVPWLALSKWPRPRNFLRPISTDPLAATRRSKKTYRTIYPASSCSVDANTLVNLQFASLIPSLLHMIEIYLIASKLSHTVLKSLDITDLSLVMTAISAPSAKETTNYERFEFLGDSILKLLTTVTVAANHPYFPEGYLTQKKSVIVSNYRLYNAAVANGLDKFIISKEFTPRGWRPLYIDDLVMDENEPGKRHLSTKTLADIVESIIGASFLDGGMAKVLSCLKLFIPEVDWQDLETGCKKLSTHNPYSTHLPTILQPLEDLIGYSFSNKALLVEAVTHASFNVGTATDSCLERLEFLGDAVLDSVIVSYLWPLNLSHQDMHLFRTACVNADLLGFITMEWTVPQNGSDVVDGKLVPLVIDFPFWSFMRFSSMSMGQVQKDTKERHAQEREAILSAMEYGTTYPWSLLAHLNMPKFFSDMFESVLGAVWVDSGSMEECEGVVKRCGILRYLQRMVDEKLDVRHPKNQLGELVQSKKLRYEVTRAGSGDSDFCCKVFVDGECIVEVSDGMSRTEIETRAADVGYEVWKQRIEDEMRE